MYTIYIKITFHFLYEGKTKELFISYLTLLLLLLLILLF